MKYKMIKPAMVAASVLLAATVSAKLPAPAPLDDAGKAKAAEAAAKTAYNGKVDGFLLCKSMDKTAAYFQKNAASQGKTAKPATATPPCADPGAFVFPPPATAAPAATATAPAAAAPMAAKPGAPTAAPAKKS